MPLITQERIVKDLVSSLATTRTASAAASGGEMATFHELSEIANSAGQPELVYKLMELSTASAVWNTRKGVAFALAGQSRARLEAHLEQLVPTLYRYTFDPNPKIAQAMRQVWSSLVPDPKATLSSQLRAVLDHLLHGITGREWRAREASCHALAEVPSKALPIYCPHTNPQTTAHALNLTLDRCSRAAHTTSYSMHSPRCMRG